MYKTHIRQWKIQKNLTERDARTILREAKRRQAFGKGTICTVGGKKIDVERARVYLRKKKIDIHGANFEDLTDDVNNHFAHTESAMLNSRPGRSSLQRSRNSQTTNRPAQRLQPSIVTGEHGRLY